MYIMIFFFKVGPIISIFKLKYQKCNCLPGKNVRGQLGPIPCLYWSSWAASTEIGRQNRAGAQDGVTEQKESSCFLSRNSCQFGARLLRISTLHLIRIPFWSHQQHTVYRLQALAQDIEENVHKEKISRQTWLTGPRLGQPWKWAVKRWYKGNDLSAVGRVSRRERGKERGREGIIKVQSVLQERSVFWKIFTNLLRIETHLPFKFCNIIKELLHFSNTFEFKHSPMYSVKYRKFVSVSYLKHTFPETKHDLISFQEWNMLIQATTLLF